jgi:hypothetical protein
MELLSMSFFHVGIADIYQTIHTLNNPKTAKACFGVLIRNCLYHPCFYDWWSNSNCHEYKLRHQGNELVLWHYCYWRYLSHYEHIGSQLSTNRFVSPRASESALSYTHRVRNGLMIAANARTLRLIGAKYTVFCNWVVLPYIERRVSCAT